MLKSELLRAIQNEIMQHDFDCFVAMGLICNSELCETTISV